MKRVQQYFTNVLNIIDTVYFDRILPYSFGSSHKDGFVNLYPYIFRILLYLK